jgi:hypothetical protein
MRKLWVLGASALLIAFSVIDEAAAQRGRGGGGGAFSGGGFQGRAIGSGFRAGSGFRGAAIGGGYRGRAITGGRYVGPRAGVRRASPRWAGRRVGVARAGVAGRRIVRGARWGGRRVWVSRRPAWRRNWWGWGWPVAAGFAFGAATAYSSCWQWDGYQWVNVCYQPYYYGPYAGYGYYYNTATVPW